MQPLLAWHRRTAASTLPPGWRAWCWGSDDWIAVGWLLLRLGVGVSLCAVPFSIALMNIGFGVAALGAALCRPPLHRLPGFWIVAALAAWVALAITVARLDGSFAGRFKVPSLCWLWLALYLGWAAFLDARLRSLALRALIIAVSAGALLAVVQRTVGLGATPPFRVDPDGKHGHGLGLLGGHLTQGFVMGCVALALLRPAVWLGIGRGWRWAGLVAASVAVVAANARNAFVGVAAGIAAGIAARGWRWLAVGAVAGALVIGLAGTALYLTQRDRFNNVLSGTDGRWAIWRTTRAMIAERPVFGVGGREAYRESYQQHWPLVNDPVKVYREFVERGAPHAHNVPLTLAAQYGIPAALCYYLWFAALALAAYRLRRADPEAWRMVAGLLALAVAAGQFEDVSQDGESVYALLLLIALALASASGPGAIAKPSTDPSIPAHA